MKKANKGKIKSFVDLEMNPDFIKARYEKCLGEFEKYDGLVKVRDFAKYETMANKKTRLKMYSLQGTVMRYVNDICQNSYKLGMLEEQGKIKDGQYDKLREKQNVLFHKIYKTMESVKVLQTVITLNVAKKIME